MQKGNKQGVVFAGKTNIGKTCAASLMCAILAAMGERFSWWYSPDLYDFLRDFDSNSSAIERVPWLIWDDAGVGHGKDWTISRLITVFERRRGLPTIVTTNLAANQWVSRDGYDKVQSRLLQNTLEWIEDGG